MLASQVIIPELLMFNNLGPGNPFAIEFNWELVGNDVQLRIKTGTTVANLANYFHLCLPASPMIPTAELSILYGASHVTYYSHLVPELGEDIYLTFFGEDLNGSETIRLAERPDADEARDAFFAVLTSAQTEDFEGFDQFDVAPLNLSIGGTLTDNDFAFGYVNAVSDPGAFSGRYPISGTKYWDDLGTTTPPFVLLTIEFDSPQEAFGFYGTDFGDTPPDVDLLIVFDDGAWSETVVFDHTSGAAGSCFYFGVINTSNPFTKVELRWSADNEGNDGFGIDDITVQAA